MTRKTRKTHKMRKVLLTVCCAALLVCISIGATVAYLTSKDTVTNTFTVGNVEITMDEAKVNPDGTKVTDEAGKDVARVQTNTYKLLPGHTYIKDPTIHVSDTSEEAYLGVKVVFENSALADEKLSLNMLSIFSGFIADNWTIQEKTQQDGDVYYLLTRKDTVTSKLNIKLFDYVVIPDEMTNEQIAYLNNIRMEITAYAVQKDGFDTPSEALTTAFATEFA